MRLKNWGEASVIKKKTHVSRYNYVILPTLHKDTVIWSKHCFLLGRLLM